jgi:CRP/FNR family transcriptional regulator, cyclic AMP receptor protein
MAAERRLVRVLDADPALGQALPTEDRVLAARYAIAEAVQLEPGPWDAHRLEAGESGPVRLGTLVLEGLLKREVRIAGSECAELLGAGDLLRPWDADEDEGFTQVGGAFEVLEPTVLAILDRRFAAAAGRWPELLDAVLGRCVLRSRALAFHMALSHLNRVEVRLLALFWHLADRWGRVGPEGVIVPLRLTHRTLAQLVGAQRPSVTTALGALADTGRVSRREDGSWLLHGEAPSALRIPAVEHAAT